MLWASSRMQTSCLSSCICTIENERNNEHETMFTGECRTLRIEQARVLAWTLARMLERSHMNVFSVRLFSFAVLLFVFPKVTAAEWRVSFANPASNQTQQSFLRVINQSSVSGLVTLSGIDDNGNPAPGGTRP